jgi:glycosyltransferase involved in cell wall biosynthesis
LAETPLRVALDGTPLLGVRTGIGRYVEHLVAELATMPDDVALRVAAFSLRGRRVLRSLPPGVRLAHRPAPARLLHRAWMHGDSPPAEWFTGSADVVHGTNFVLPPPSRAAGVVTVHDLTFLRYPELVDAASLAYRELVPQAVRTAARVLTPTRAVADELIEAYRLPAERVCATPLGVDSSWFDAAPARPPDVPAAYVLAVGTLQPRKGLDVLLAAYRALIAEDPAVPPLVLVGPPGWGAGLDLTGLPPGRLVLPGYVDARTLRGLVAGAAVLAFPSRYEGFGLPPLEALAAGTPVVASDVPAVREVLGRHARLVPPGDPDALAAALGRVLAEPPDGRVREAASQHARAFTWRRCAELTLAAYRSAVA